MDNKVFHVLLLHSSISLVTMSILFYQRPDYIAKPKGSLDASQCQKYVDRATSYRSEIPPELSFETILADQALPVRLWSLKVLVIG